jgi:hypothetical protein
VWSTGAVTIDQDATPTTASPPHTGLLAAAVGCAVGAVAVIAAATATRDHAFWLFVLWVSLTVAAVACGIVALVRLPRAPATRNRRRLATLAVVVGVGCATLGLAVYSSTRSDDCPRDAPCTIPQSGPGQRDQQP